MNFIEIIIFVATDFYLDNEIEEHASSFQRQLREKLDDRMQWLHDSIIYNINDVTGAPGNEHVGIV